MLSDVGMLRGSDAACERAGVVLSLWEKIKGRLRVGEKVEVKNKYRKNGSRNSPGSTGLCKGRTSRDRFGMVSWPDKLPSLGDLMIKYRA